MIGTQHNLFGHLKADSFGDSGFNLFKFILNKIAQNQLADIMQQGGRKYFLGGFDLQHFYQTFGGNRSGY